MHTLADKHYSTEQAQHHKNNAGYGHIASLGDTQHFIFSDNIPCGNSFGLAHLAKVGDKNIIGHAYLAIINVGNIDAKCRKVFEKKS